jgi:hypothetical protein
MSGCETLAQAKGVLYADFRGAAQVVQTAGLRRGYERP